MERSIARKEPFDLMSCIGKYADVQDQQRERKGMLYLHRCSKCSNWKVRILLVKGSKSFKLLVS